jgi:hypothetical protein
MLREADVKSNRRLTDRRLNYTPIKPNSDLSKSAMSSGDRLIDRSINANLRKPSNDGDTFIIKL